jgi:hypothetical protein
VHSGALALLLRHVTPDLAASTHQHDTSDAWGWAEVRWAEVLATV